MTFQDEGPRLRTRFQQTPAGKALPHGDGSSFMSPTGDSEGTELSTSSRSSAADSTALRERTVRQVLEDRSRRDGILAAVVSDADCHTLDDDNTALSELPVLVNHPVHQAILAPELQQQQLLSAFTASISPVSQCISPAATQQTQWLQALPPLTGKHPLLDTSIRALTLCHLGMVNSSFHFVNQSCAFYGKALILLNNAIRDQIKGMASETLSATILLSYYEMFASADNASWVRHAGGAGTLMRLRGPWRHRSGVDKEMFLAYRNSIIIEAFETGTVCFLDEPEWQQLSRTIYEEIRDSGVIGDEMGIYKMAESFFMEIAQLPGLVQDARNIPGLAGAAGVDLEVVREAIISRATMHRAKLKSIYARLIVELKKLRMSPTTEVDPSDMVFPLRFNYPNIYIGSAFCGYWTVMMIVTNVMRDIDQDPQRQAIYMLENHEAATNAASSAAYMARSSFLGPFYGIYALRLSLLTIRGRSEQKWLVRKLMEFGDTRLSMAKEIDGLAENPEVAESIRSAVREALDGV